MLKMLFILVSFMAVALALLGLRQQRLEVNSQSSAVYDRIQERRQTLLDQRAEIARKTNPWALASALQQAGVNTGEALRPRSTRTAGPAIPAVETDLIAPLVGEGHVNPNRPRP